MARSRNIKPGFFTNDALVELPFEVRLLFIGLWLIADKKGRLYDRPKKIKMEIFPADDVDCNAAISMLCDKGFLVRYSVNGTNYIQVTNWQKHQNPHMKEHDSVIPENPMLDRENPALARLIPDSLNLIPDSLNPSTPLSGDARPPSDVQTVFQHWKQKLNHPKAKLTPDRQRKISIALKNYPVASLCQAIDGCAVTPHNMGQNDRGEVYDDIELILRKAANIERFMRNAESPPKPNGGNHAKPSKLQRAAEAIRRANPGRYGPAADVQNDGAQPGLRTLSGGSAGRNSGDD